ncbi:hypothetical protein G9U51_10620 [Calidifontibacter sp. DB0510]|uniref:Uncharacterized protein n=1 Tax=Metallococcus carri TaxID=1656884 RepID=A0A967B0U6_9MICO|nr:hypothetical protein [Metallococcus carri]NHN56228.1 hypothetical protein [Metallococcus carri]NOP38721.1 hypothetical protein [Calidifontibacter sp. DB2511S]
MNTAQSLRHQPIDRDAERVAYDLAVVRSRRRPTLLARAAHRTWREIVGQWREQTYLQRRIIEINSPWNAPRTGMH